MSNKYKPGTKVSHSVYGDGTVTDVTEMGKHWSIKVDFEEGPRTVLSTFLTLKDVSEVIDHVMFPESSTVLVIPYATVPFQVFEPGTKVSHAIFGVGEVKDSKPKGENYRLDIDFEDGTSKTLLSTFIEIVSDDSTEGEDDDEMNDDGGENEVVEAEAIAVETEAVIAEPVEEVVEAEAVTAEPVEEVVEVEAVLDTDVVYSKPEKDDAEAIIDLSKPEVQDAEIVDEDD